MNKFVSTALGLVAVGSIGAADPGDGDWLGLDSEINGLASSLAPTSDGSGWSALLRVRFGHSSDDISTGGGSDLSGFDLADVDLAFWANSGDFRYRISGDLDSGSDFDLEDAYAEWLCGTDITARIGHFKPRVLRSNFIDPEDTLFLDRTVLGSTFDQWDLGASAHGALEGFMWSFALMNGATGQFSDHFYALRVSYDFGAGAGSMEGARGGNDELNATLGLAITSHTGLAGGASDNMSTFLDFNGNFGQFGFGLDYGMVDDDDFGIVSSDFGQLIAPVVVMGDTNPYSLTGSYLLNPDIEIGLRHEDLDDTDDTSLLTLGVGWYRNGNNGKWIFQYTDVSTDSGPEGSYFQAGLTVGASR